MSKQGLQVNKAMYGEIKTLIEQSKQQVAIAVNSTMAMLYWQIGRRINQEVLKEKRADYGKQIVSTLSKQLVEDFGGSFSEKNMRRMMQFAVVFPDYEKVVSLIRQLVMEFDSGWRKKWIQQRIMRQDKRLEYNLRESAQSAEEMEVRR